MIRKIIILGILLTLFLSPISSVKATEDFNTKYLEILTKIEQLLQELKNLVQSSGNLPPIITPVIPQPVQPAAEEEVIISLNLPVTNNLIEMELNLVEVGTNYADIEINYFDRKNYPGTVTQGSATGWVPNPNFYPEYYSGSDLLSSAKVVYRTHKYCNGTMKEDVWNKGYQVIELSGYSNYLCRNRFREQCVLDGTYDNYYDERCDFGRIKFQLGETKYSSNFSIKLMEILGNNQVKVKITSKETTALISPDNIELMKIRGQSGIYAVDKNRQIKMPVYDSAILDSYGLKSSAAKEVTTQVLDKYSTSKPVGLNEKSLVKGKNKATVYVVTDGELKPISSPSALQKAGYKWENLKVVSDNVINLYSVGEAIK